MFIPSRSVTFESVVQAASASARFKRTVMNGGVIDGLSRACAFSVQEASESLARSKAVSATEYNPYSYKYNAVSDRIKTNVLLGFP